MNSTALRGPLGETAIATNSPIALKWCAQVSALLLLYSDVFSGALRYALNSVGLVLASYVPMLAAIATVILTLLLCGFYSSLDRRITSVILVFLAFGAYGVDTGRSWQGVTFSLYAWSPFFLGMLVIRFDLFKKLEHHILFLLVASVVGVLINTKVPLPWIGADNFAVGGLEVSAALDWKTFGVSRLPGFAKSSMTAANDITLFSMWLLCTARPLLVKIAIWAGALYATTLTTSKTPMLLLLLGPVLIFTLIALTRKRTGPTPVKTFYSYAVLFCLLGTMIALPLVSSLRDAQGTHLPFEDSLPFLRLDSLADRINTTWPQAFQLLQVGGGPLAAVLGRGIGGIGVGQKFTEAHIYNSGDNLYVFLYVTFGLSSYFLYALLVHGHHAAIAEERLPFAVYFATLIYVLGLGTLTSVVEGALPALSFGILVAVCISPRDRRPRASNATPPKRRERLTMRVVGGSLAPKEETVAGIVIHPGPLRALAAVAQRT